MSMQDPIADMLTRIRNALAVSKEEVDIPASKIKIAIAKTLVDAGYISDFAVLGKDEIKPILRVKLKYQNGQPVIVRLDRVSSPGVRNYKGKNNLPQVDNGLGVSIISTSKGVMTDQEARRAGLGGEVLCLVS